MPAVLNGQNVCDEVAFRIGNRLPANGTGPGSIINFTNDVLGLIGASASWVWDLLTVAGINVASGFNPASQIDTGKEISVFETNTGRPVNRLMQADTYAASSGYVGVGANDVNGFQIYIDSGTLTPALAFYPVGCSGTVYIMYHQYPPVLVYGSSPTVRWVGIYGMDMLLKDWATANVMKYLNMSGWDTLWADCMGRLGEFRRMYTTERENMGPEDEAPKVVQEKATVGRV